MTRKEEIIANATQLARAKEQEEQCGTEFTTNELIAFYVKGAKWADRTMLKKACEWLKLNAVEYLEEQRIFGNITHHLDVEQLVADFRKEMEE